MKAISSMATKQCERDVIPTEWIKQQHEKMVSFLTRLEFSHNWNYWNLWKVWKINMLIFQLPDKL